MRERIKQIARSEKLFLAVIVILVGFSSYFLGVLEGQSISDRGEVTPTIVFTQSATEQEGRQLIPVVASKSGNKYHHLDCPGAKTIKEANLIRFASVDLAEAAGYTPAKNCFAD